jgi:hypothetical protein
MVWNKFKDKTPPQTTLLAVYRVDQRRYTMCYYNNNHWVSIDKWFFKCGDHDMWLEIGDCDDICEKNK